MTIVRKLNQFKIKKKLIKINKINAKTLISHKDSINKIIKLILSKLIKIQDLFYIQNTLILKII